ncbi:MAG: glycosyltransferase family 87 protein [Halobacteriales archaeon]
MSTSAAGGILHGPQPARAVLLLGILSGLAVPLYFLGLAHETPLAWDFIAYYAAGEAVFQGESFVGLVPPFGEGTYVYPPVVVLGFLPLVLLGDWTAAYLLHALLSVILLGSLGVLCVRELDHLGVEIAEVDKALIVAFTTLSLYPMVALGLGQVDPLVAVLLAGSFLALERRQAWRAGSGLALAAVIKLFPAAFAIILLRLRRWRAALAALVVGTAITGTSVLVFGASVHRDYITLITEKRSRLSAFAEGMDPNFFDVTLARPLAALLPDVYPIAYLVVAVALVAPAVYVVYDRVETRLDRHVAYLATMTAVLIASPATNLNHLLYLYFPLVVLIYALDHPRQRAILLGGLVVLLLPVQPEQLSTALSAAGASPTTVASVDAVARQLMSTASVALVGAAIVLIGCVAAALDLEFESLGHERRD